MGGCGSYCCLMNSTVDTSVKLQITFLWLIVIILIVVGSIGWSRISTLEKRRNNAIQNIAASLSEGFKLIKSKA